LGQPKTDEELLAVAINYHARPPEEELVGESQAEPGIVPVEGTPAGEGTPAAAGTPAATATP
jgi:hypothetical protein